MFNIIKTWLARWRFERAFKDKLQKIEDTRRKHGPVRLSQADLRATVERALASKASA